jgi:hypothetical protein
MQSNAAFTICAKNYLAQAITLKESFIENNPENDFYIFLADKICEENIEIKNLIEADSSIIKNIEQMSFQYNIIEFSTSIKPFCFQYLLNKYSKVIYLDPDIYITSSLNRVYENLENYDVIITPHYNYMEEKYTGSVSEEEILFVGIYNLGFCAFKKSLLTENILKWWTNRLENQCYADKFDSLHVDQRWIDFLPCFYNRNVLIDNNIGMNVAIWNLHERKVKLINSKYYVYNENEDSLEELKFFHFSGFDPRVEKVINRRHKKFDLDKFQSIKYIIEEYRNKIILNGYDKYCNLGYYYNSFTNGLKILPLHRRLYRKMKNEYQENPISSNSDFYKTLKKNRLLLNIKSNTFSSVFNEKEKKYISIYQNIIIKILLLTKSIVGIRYYLKLMEQIIQYARVDNQGYLIRKK